MTVTRLLPAAAAAATLLLAAALFHYGVDPVPYWSWGFARDTFYHVVGGALLAGLLYAWNRDNAAFAFASVIGLYVAGGVGIMATLSVLLFACAAFLLGRRVLAYLFPAQTCSATAALVCGLAVYLAVLGVMIHFPVNYRAVYALLLGMPVAAEAVTGGLPLLRQRARHVVAQARVATTALPYWMFAAAVIGGVLVARIAFLPSIGFDDNALHLRLWSQLRYEHRFGFDYIAHVWEVAPFIVDLLHATASLVAGTEARGATNLFLLAILLRQLWIVLGALQLDAGKRLLALMLFASTPLLGHLLLSHQTELFLAVMAVTAVRLTLELRGTIWSPDVAALLAIAALCCGTKLTGAVLGLALLVPGAVRVWTLRSTVREEFRPRILPLAAFVAGLALLAFNAYATAWVKTGNPVFPLYNGIFLSPYFEPYNFEDMRWHRGFSLGSYWDLFFNTAAYNESGNNVAGFQYLLLLPLGMLALPALRSVRPLALPLLAPLAGFGLIMFAAIQYWRYLFPVLPLGTVVTAVLLVPGYSRAAAWFVKGALLACIAFNALFYPGISTLLGEAPGRVWTASAKQRALEYFVPARVLTEWINANAPRSNVLYPEGIPFGAMLHGTPIYVNWYSPANSSAFYAVRDESEGMAFLRERKVEFVIAHMNDPGLPGTRAWALRAFLAKVGLPLRQVEDHILYQVGADLPAYAPLFRFDERMELDTTPKPVGSVTPGAARAVRYSAEFACIDAAGYFVAQVNWDNGQFYYHRVNCSSAPLQFVESFPLPPGANAGTVYAYTSETSGGTLTQLTLEILE